ncbi:MAG: B12-binding domain-containing protein [Acidobacteria bacterium]|nr:B12-binding domain-containing protein [Acidobacteriota bacterium]
MSIFEELQQAIIDGKGPVAKELTEKALSEGTRAADIFPKAIIPAMNEVGRRMRECEFFIPYVQVPDAHARVRSSWPIPSFPNCTARYWKEYRGHDAGERRIHDRGLGRRCWAR